MTDANSSVVQRVPDDWDKSVILRDRWTLFELRGQAVDDVNLLADEAEAVGWVKSGDQRRLVEAFGACQVADNWGQAFLERSHSQFLAAFDSFASAPDGMPRAIQDEQVSHALVAWLLSFRLALDHLCRDVKHAFGKGSAEMAALDAAIRREFDSNPAYRLVDGLRNHVAHHQPPMASMDIRRPLDGRASAEYALDRDLWLKVDKRLKASIRPTLVASPRYVPVQDLVTSVMDSMARIVDVAAGMRRPYLAQSVRDARAMIGFEPRRGTTMALVRPRPHPAEPLRGEVPMLQGRILDLRAYFRAVDALGQR